MSNKRYVLLMFMLVPHMTQGVGFFRTIASALVASRLLTRSKQCTPPRRMMHRFPNSASEFDKTPTRHLKAPQLELQNWGKKIVCHRPMRYGSPCMHIEKKDKKIVAHNYGHGGSGWTVAPICAQRIVALFDQGMQNAHRSREAPIQIVGAGVLGLFTAYELIARGYSNITITAENFDDLASHKAGGFLAPSTMDVDPGTQKSINTICFDAYRFYEHIACGGNSNFPAGGALIMPIYLKRDDTRLHAYEGVVMDSPQDVVMDFGNGKRYEMKVYDDGIFIDTGIMMNALTTFLQDKVRWVQKKVFSFEELEESFIFNCTGLGAQQINHDDAVVSVQGHLILLKNQNPAEMNYMISFNVNSEQSETGQFIRRSLYVFPKHVPNSPQDEIGVVGGTFIEGATKDTPNEREFALIIKRTREFFGT